MSMQRRDLRTGRPYWLSQPMPRIPVLPLTRDVRTEVLVVGAGISGALVAEALSERHTVIVVDRRGVAKGSTSASTALVEYEIDTPLIHLSRNLGRVDAGRAWRRSYLAVRSLAARTRELGIKCDMSARDSLYLSGNVLGVDALQKECEARRAVGIETQFLSRDALRERFGIARPSALLAFDDVAVDPRRLTAGYLRVAAGRGTRLFAPVEVTDIEIGRGETLAATAGGPTIRCSVIVYATGYELPPFIPAKGHRVASTYAIATRPQPRRLWPERCFIWEASDPYLYLRTTEDGRVICGGEDEDFSDAASRDGLISKKVAAIRRKLSRLLPELDTEPEFVWAGAFGISTTGLPLIGEVPGRKNCWAVLGYGGNGITYSRIAADIIRAALANDPDPDADLYAFSAAPH